MKTKTFRGVTIENVGISFYVRAFKRYVYFGSMAAAKRWISEQLSNGVRP